MQRFCPLREVLGKKGITMRKILVATALCLTLALLAVGGARADSFINFDDVANGTVINTHYAGVTFTCNVAGGGCPDATGNVYAGFNNDALSPTNVLTSIFVPSAVEQGAQTDTTSGAIIVAFSTPQSAVSIEAFAFLSAEVFGTPGYAYMQVYNSSLTAISPYITDTAVSGGAWSPLSFSSAAGNISYLLLGDVSNNNSATLWDNLCFSTSSTGCAGSTGGGPTNTPEPASFALLGFGLLALAARNRLRVQHS